MGSLLCKVYWIEEIASEKTRHQQFGAHQIAQMIAQLTPIEQTATGRELINIGLTRGLEKGLEQGLEDLMDAIFEFSKA